jgi:hypothetical protein
LPNNIKLNSTEILKLMNIQLNQLNQKESLELKWKGKGFSSIKEQMSLLTLNHILLLRCGSKEEKKQLYSSKG